jgi:hypothetical protein
VTGHFFLSQAGYWVRGDGNRINAISTFQGLLFRETPRNAFGWTFEQIPIKNAPGYGAADTEKKHQRVYHSPSLPHRNREGHCLEYDYRRRVLTHLKAYGKLCPL